MKKLLFTLSMALFAQGVWAQNKKNEDVNAIKNMCGCYEVTFAFGETFSPDKDYKFHENHLSKGLEWVQLVEEGKDKIVLQHLLITTDSVGKQDIVKHWRQDWLYENTDLYQYTQDNTWKFVRLPKTQVKGQWTQKVFQVDDSPRYEGTATWVHLDGRHYWENTTDSPLPRREFTTRHDYNVMKRRNRQEITASGWLHEQDNDKIQRNATSDKLIAQEKGWNTYEKTSVERCALAQKYWQEKQAFWANVRATWQTIFAQNQDLKLAKAIDKKPLFMHLFDLKPEQTQDIKPIIEKFLVKR